MSVAALPEALSTIPEQLFRLSVEQYHDMIERGVLGPDDKVELLDGYLFQKTSKNPPHSLSIILAIDLVRGLLPPGWHIQSEQPVTLGRSEPEPDLWHRTRLSPPPLRS